MQLQANEYFDRLNLIELLTLFGKLYSQEIDPIKLLQAVNLADKANAKPEELSGGQKCPLWSHRFSSDSFFCVAANLLWSWEDRVGAFGNDFHRRRVPDQPKS